GVETLREGGLLAFITSQGVMNSPANEEIRKWLMNNTNLVSAIRLPNDLFTDYAGTEVGSDLIILQKNSQKQSLTEEEQAFVSTRELSNGITINNYFQDFSRVVHTQNYTDTDPYGKPALVFKHEKGVEGIAGDLKKMLDADFSQNLNLVLYESQSQSAQQKQVEVKTNTSLPKQSEVLHTEEKNSFQALEVNVSEPVVSLYDLFGFSEAERTQIKPVRGKKKAMSTKNGKPVQLSMFSETPKGNTKNANAYPISDARKEEQQDRLKQEEERKQALELRPFSGDLQKHYKTGSLVEDKGQMGYLKEVYKDGAEFQPLDVAFDQKAKISRYIEIRDFYHTLYNHEAKHLTERASLRSNLNLVYDNFVKRYGNFNDKRNLDVIKMDAGGKEMLFLERSIDGKLQKADIFHKPVAFNPNEIKAANTSDETLVASLNKYGEIRMEYMESLMTEKSREDIISDLHGRIYFNPLIQNYEIKDSFIAGNIVEKSEQIERYLQNHPDDQPAQESLKALQDATPLPIRFEELDFNFGERWISTDVFEQYIEKLFDTNVSIDYYASRDDFMIKSGKSNPIINEKFAVQGEGQLFTGIHLLKHALLNTTPNITKTITVPDKETGEMKKVKVADGQAIQLANTKIDEIRNGFSDWLDGQSPEFKEKLADTYNRKFNCFVRPQYDGS
ncbi:MAG: N-6 DNA methylase, partial [Lachnospiraceae bacterium]